MSEEGKVVGYESRADYRGFMQKGAFQLRLSPLRVECEERVCQVERTACSGDVRWEFDCPFQEWKKAKVTEGLDRRGGVSGSRWFKAKQGSKQKTLLHNPNCHGMELIYRKYWL